uniref:Uncharacterized protein n=1 Tax=viral metagenome TaxID=1070528 RepID=A0A6C0H7Q0_9ZZZZ
MIDNYYTAKGKYMEHMENNNLCAAVSNNTANIMPLEFILTTEISNNGNAAAPPLEHIVGILPKSALISEIAFNIISTDQGSGNNIGTQYELVLKYGNTQHPLTNRIWCVDVTGTTRSNNITDIYKFNPYLLTLENDVKLVLKLYNLYEVYRAKITSYKINVTAYK